MCISGVVCVLLSVIAVTPLRVPSTPLRVTSACICRSWVMRMRRRKETRIVPYAVARHPPECRIILRVGGGGGIQVVAGRLCGITRLTIWWLAILIVSHRVIRTRRDRKGT